MATVYQLVFAVLTVSAAINVVQGELGESAVLYCS